MRKLLLALTLVTATLTAANAHGLSKQQGHPREPYRHRLFEPKYTMTVFDWEVPNPKESFFWLTGEREGAYQKLADDLKFFCAPSIAMLRSDQVDTLVIFAAYTKYHGLSLSRQDVVEYLQWENEQLTKLKARLMASSLSEDEKLDALHEILVYEASRFGQAELDLYLAKISEHSRQGDAGCPRLHKDDADRTPFMLGTLYHKCGLEPGDELRWDRCLGKGFYRTLRQLEDEGKIVFHLDQMMPKPSALDGRDYFDAPEGGRFVTPPWKRAKK